MWFPDVCSLHARRNWGGAELSFSTLDLASSQIWSSDTGGAPGARRPSWDPRSYPARCWWLSWALWAPCSPTAELSSAHMGWALASVGPTSTAPLVAPWEAAASGSTGETFLACSAGGPFVIDTIIPRLGCSAGTRGGPTSSAGCTRSMSQAGAAARGGVARCRDHCHGETQTEPLSGTYFHVNNANPALCPCKSPPGFCSVVRKMENLELTYTFSQGTQCATWRARKS